MNADDEAGKRDALAAARAAARKYIEADTDRAIAMIAARHRGASLREIAEATGVPHATVSRIIERHTARYERYEDVRGPGPHGDPESPWFDGSDDGRVD